MRGEGREDLRLQRNGAAGGDFGDGVPGSAVYFSMKGLEEFHRELTAKNYRHARPGILDQEWGMREIMISDPSGNKLRFGEPKS